MPTDMIFRTTYLVLASGVTHAYFGHDEWSKVAPGLKQLEDARDIRARFLMAFEKAEIADDEAERRKLLTFVIVGGGPTGVEMAGAMAEVARETLRADFRRIDPRASRIVLIEAGPRILPTLPENLSRYAQAVLENMGVEVKVDTRVTGCDAGRRHARRHAYRCIDDRMGGGREGVARGAMDRRANRSRRAHPGRTRICRCRAMPDIFVIGDLASVTDKNGKPVPGIAPAAKQMGRYVGRLISARVAGRADAKALRLSPCRRSRHRRAQSRGGEDRALRTHRLSRLAVLGRSPHLFSDRIAQPFRGRGDLAVELSHVPARRAADLDAGFESVIPEAARSAAIRNP